MKGPPWGDDEGPVFIPFLILAVVLLGLILFIILIMRR
jgi:hypothetical protein